MRFLNESADFPRRSHTHGFWGLACRAAILALAVGCCSPILAQNASPTGSAPSVPSAPSPSTPTPSNIAKPAAGIPSPAPPISPAASGSSSNDSGTLAHPHHNFLRPGNDLGVPEAPPVPATAPTPGTSDLSTVDPAPAPDPDAEIHQLQQSQDELAHANLVARRTFWIAVAVLLLLVAAAVFATFQLYRRARSWNRLALEAQEQSKTLLNRLEPLLLSQDDIRHELPRLLQQVGEHPLNFQEEGTRFPAQSLTALDEIDHLAYLGHARLSFQSLPEGDAAVYLNGLLLSSVAQLARSDFWTAISRLDQFFGLVGRYSGAVDAHRVAQAYSYRALAAYQILESQDREPSWLRKTERQEIETLARQAFSDVAQSTRLDPEWKHAAFVEALLCSRFYTPDEMGESSRAELYIRGLRRSITIYKQLIEEKSFRGPARHNLARCYKRIAEQTGEKSDFSDFGYALSAFPTDEELSDEALASRQPDSRDRFLWQWMMADPELFRSVERINMAEYRSFWIRLLDNKVHLRNWRGDLGELQRRDPSMREWSVQLLHVDPPISLASPVLRRERFDAPSSGA
jgi:hypothetical protein